MVLEVAALMGHTTPRATAKPALRSESFTIRIPSRFLAIVLPPLHYL